MRPLTVDIYDEISVKAVSGKSVLQALGPAKGSTEILVRMNSPGGDVTEGLAIYSLLLEQRKAGVKVRCRIDGLCASIATVIACAADTVEMAENAFYCIHDPMNGGNLAGARSADLRDRADLLDSMTTNLVSIYCAKTGLGEDEIRKLMADDRVITAAKALELGFINKILPANLKAVASIRLDRLPKHLLTQVPQALHQAKAKMEELEAINAAIAELRAALAKMSEDMEAMKGNAKAQDEEVPPKETEEETEASASAAARVLKTVMAATGIKDINKLEGAVMALSAKAIGTSLLAHTENVSKAIASGRLLPAMKTMALGMTPENFATYLALVGDTKLAPVGTEHKPDATKAAELVQGTTKASTTIDVTENEIALARIFSAGKDPVEYARKIKAS